LEKKVDELEQGQDDFTSLMSHHVVVCPIKKRGKLFLPTYLSDAVMRVMEYNEFEWKGRKVVWP
jgi:hypothetical protein